MTASRALCWVFVRPPLTLVALAMLGSSAVVVAADHVADKAADKKVQAAAEQAIAADPAASARRTFALKRGLPHAAVADAPAERSTAYLASLRAPAAPGAPAAAAIADGNAQLGYVGREHATPRSRGMVVLFDDRERLPGTNALLGRVAERLALGGWDTWTLALPEVAPAAALPRERSHATVPAAAAFDSANGPTKGDAQAANNSPAGKSRAKAKPAAQRTGPQLSRRRWAVPVSNAKAVPAAPIVAWQELVRQRMGLLMQAAQAAARAGGQNAAQAGGSTGGATEARSAGPLPVVVVGAGLAADFVAQQTVAEHWAVAALVLIDLLAPPADLPLALDAAVAALPAPTLAISWRASDPIAPGVWRRLPEATRQALPTATADEVGRVVGGWLEAEMQRRRR